MSLLGQLASHRDMVADSVRVGALVQAVTEAVDPGDVVVDVGTGTGLLAVAAARAGARRVYAIEAVEEILAVAREVVVDNGVADRVVLLQGTSTEVELEERAHVVIAELVGTFGLEEDIVRYVADARRRFLRAEGRLVPEGLRLMAAPTEQGVELTTWSCSLHARLGIDLGALQRRTRHLPCSVIADPHRLLGAGEAVLDCDLRQQEPGVLRGRTQARLERSGRLAGWVGWFQMRCAGRSILSTAPPAAGSSWGHLLLPAGDAIPVEAGGTASLDLRFDPPFWSWRMRVGDACRSFSEFDALPPTAWVPAAPSGERS